MNVPGIPESAASFTFYSPPIYKLAAADISSLAAWSPTSKSVVDNAFLFKSVVFDELFIRYYG